MSQNNEGSFLLPIMLGGCVATGVVITMMTGMVLHWVPVGIAMGIVMAVAKTMNG